MIVGVLSRSTNPVDESIDLLTQLESSDTDEPIALYIIAYTLDGQQQRTFFEVSLIRCEGSTTSRQTRGQQHVVNNLLFERFSTLSSVGGAMATTDIKSEVDTIRAAFDNALCIASNNNKVLDYYDHTIIILIYLIMGIVDH